MQYSLLHNTVDIMTPFLFDRSASRTSNASDEWTRVPAAEATPVGNYTALPPLPNIAELIQNSHDVRYVL